MYLNVQLDPQRRRTTITHEAAVRVGQTFHSFYLLFVRTEYGEVGSLAADGADTIVWADKRRPADPAEKGPDILLDEAGARHMARYLRAGWKSDEKIGAMGRCPGSNHWPGRLNAVNPIRDPGWTCVEYVRTGMSKGDTIMRMMFDTIREDPRYSSCKYVLSVLDWKGRRKWIRAWGVSYTTLSEQRDAWRAPGRRSRKSPGRT